MSIKSKIILGFLVSGIILGIIGTKLFLLPLIIFPYYIIILLIHNPRGFQEWFLWCFCYGFFSMQFFIDSYGPTIILLYIASFSILIFKNFKK